MRKGIVLLCVFKNMQSGIYKEKSATESVNRIMINEMIAYKRKLI